MWYLLNVQALAIDPLADNVCDAKFEAWSQSTMYPSVDFHDCQLSHLSVSICLSEFFYLSATVASTGDLHVLMPHSEMATHITTCSRGALLSICRHIVH